MGAFSFEPRNRGQERARRLVAAMVVHGITQLLTFNKQDFQRFTNITVEVVAMP
jgi:predicted nucleic acid-binding protein